MKPETPPSLTPGTKVTLLIGDRTNLGFIVLINNKEEGLLYHNEIFETINEGDVKTGYIKKLRNDGKLDVSLQNFGYRHIEESANVVINKLKANGGLLPVGDKTPPEEIYNTFGISKKAFKKITGALYKKRLISISDYEMHLIDERGE